MKIKKYSIIIIALTLLLTIAFSAIPSYALTSSMTGDGQKLNLFANKFELKNWQQTYEMWADYVVSDALGTEGKNSIAYTGCGILALCNAVHYATGYFMIPLEVAKWGNEVEGYRGDATDASILYPKYFTSFGDQIGLTTTSTSSIKQYVGSGSKATIISQIKNGATFIAHVYNHFIAIVDYNSKTDKFLVWDSYAGTKDDGTAISSNRANITHTSGDWFTWDQLQGSISDKFDVDYVIPFIPVAGKQLFYVERTDLMFGTTKLQNSGDCCDFTPVDFSANGGNKLTFTGSYTGSKAVTAIGYKVDGSSIMWSDVSFTETTSASKTAGEKMVGTDSYTKNFSISVPVTSSTKRVDIMIGCGGETSTIWTALAVNNTTTGTVYTGKTTEPTATAKPAATATAKATAMPTATPAATEAPAKATYEPVTTEAPTTTEAPMATEGTEATCAPVTPNTPSEAETEEEANDTESAETIAPIATIDNVATSAPEATNETVDASEPKTTNNGCKSVICEGSIVFTLLAFTAVCTLRKKKN